jgi:hypothetical protein
MTRDTPSAFRQRLLVPTKIVSNGRHCDTSRSLLVSFSLSLDPSPSSSSSSSVSTTSSPSSTPSTDGLLALELTAEEDPLFLWRLHLKMDDFEQLRNEQNLLVAFHQFPNQLVSLLMSISGSISDSGLLLLMINSDSLFISCLVAFR